MSKNLDLARECGVAIYNAVGNYPPLARFTIAQLDAFAERIRAEQKSGAPEPSGERAALIASLLAIGGDDYYPFCRRAADMLAADAPEQEPVGWLTQAGVFMGPSADVSKNGALYGWKPVYLAPLAPQARELSGEQISAAARVLSDRAAECCKIDREDNWKIYGDAYIEDARAMFKAAVLAARSKP